jgi:uracil-DNA glycosylase
MAQSSLKRFFAATVQSEVQPSKRLLSAIASKNSPRSNAEEDHLGDLPQSASAASAAETFCDKRLPVLDGKAAVEVLNFSDLDLALPSSWGLHLKGTLEKPFWSQLKKSLQVQQSAGKTIFPPPNKVFAALQLTPLSEVRVVIVGQDPYHDHAQAHGLCFSVPHGVTPPPSLVNMYKELHEDPAIDFSRPNHGCLESWARQGVLLLNTSLTVRAHEAASHKGLGWEAFTDAVIDAINAKCTGIVFLLWGKHAEEKARAA